MRIAPALLAVGAVALAAACRREERRFQDAAMAARRPAPPPAVSLRPAEPPAPDAAAAASAPLAPRAESAPENAWAISQGQQLFVWFNCAGCHGHEGGGDIGPPLIDATWLYGGTPGDIYRSITEGRRNGMPAFGGKIPEQQLWQLVAYVRALAGLVPADARPGRTDSLATKKAPTLWPVERPRAPAGPGDERP